jgi:hypothetical protein
VLATLARHTSSRFLTRPASEKRHRVSSWIVFDSETRANTDTLCFAVGQLPQTSYLSLQAPYSFGLGRTNNYVENLFVGSTRHQDQHFMNIEGLIPNSQVVIVPWQPDDEHDPSTWSKQLFLQPGKWIPWVGVTLITTTVILAITVLFLHLNEKVGRLMLSSP